MKIFRKETTSVQTLRDLHIALTHIDLDSRESVTLQELFDIDEDDAYEYEKKYNRQPSKDYSKKIKKEDFTTAESIGIVAGTDAVLNYIDKKNSINKKKKEIENLKLLLIDEYQDFSQMFYDLINEIRINNPNIKLFCVGDNWQAINGFAGSELKFFQNFDKYFNNTGNSSLAYNYRSGKSIVDLGNKIMIDNGVPAKCFRTNIKTRLVKCYVDEVQIYQPNTKDFDKQFMYDGKSFFDINHRYFKLCYCIIKNNINKNFIILHRTNNIAQYYKLTEFKEALIKKFKKEKINIESQIKVDTIHKFKGDEADIVIILECDNKNFPLLHPDNEIYYIFGETPQDFLDEERRLLYVAVTRAKEQIYFLCEKSDENIFIKSCNNIYIEKYC